MKHPKDLRTAAQNIIHKIQYCTVATVNSDGSPWNSPVFCAYDEKYNFYFSTDTMSQKARNIAQNQHVSLVIYDSTVPAGTGIGVYLTGNAELLTNDSEKKFAHEILKSRRAPTSFHDYQEYNTGPYGLYRVTPSRVMMNTESNRLGSYVDKKVVISLT